ncbi:hypothetical protein CISG_10218 [Coccidioides immitis RMSCC 3703]|uniref:Uncharacterized protein n=1 Tax=Coccidioides immitis RMSCC 3703 TaxID=454286 RepID=A0A0J8QMY7_COCIT|nr:hypothetical protein CISG_10218 [Coccidioides immitis RMSCC 3703]
MISETPLNLPANYASSTPSHTPKGILIIQEVSTEITKHKSEESCTLNYSWCLLSNDTNEDGHAFTLYGILRSWHQQAPADEVSKVFYHETVVLLGMDAV